MPVDLLIRGGWVVRASGVNVADVSVDDGRIIEISADISTPARRTIDAGGLHVFPGLVDPHVHFNEPGRADWEGFETGSSALAAGGGTLFFDMPLNSTPPVIDAAAFDAKRDAGLAKSRTDFGIWAGLVPANLDALESLADRGVVGFKAFMSDSGIAEFPAADDLTLYRGMKIAKSLGLPVAVHAESDAITSRLTREATAAGKTSARDYAATRPVVAETEAISRAILLAEETGCRLHVVHVSSSRGVELVRRAASRGEADVTCETCPHYLSLTIDDLDLLGASAKCAPPVRTAATVDDLWRNLTDGNIAFVASDHSPAPASMKSDPNFFKVWGGIAGVQSTLSLLLGRHPTLPLPQVARWIAGAAAIRFGIEKKGFIEVGFDADFAIVDVPSRYELRREDLLDRHKLSPYVGRAMRGKTSRTFLRGVEIFASGRMTGRPFVRLVKPRRSS